MNPIDEITEAARLRNLLTAKHDPNELSITWAKARSVLTTPASSSLENFIIDEAYKLHQYNDATYPGGNGLFVFHPASGSSFNSVGSFVPSGSVTPSGSLDCLVAVYGKNQGWYVYADNFANIDLSVSSGRLTLVNIHNKTGSTP